VSALRKSKGTKPRVRPTSLPLFREGMDQKGAAVLKTVAHHCLQTDVPEVAEHLCCEVGGASDGVQIGAKERHVTKQPSTWPHTAPSPGSSHSMEVAMDIPGYIPMHASSDRST
jgi:hypothetical protein